MTGPIPAMPPPPPRSVRVLVVDDHPIVRKGLVELIDEQPDLSVCAEAANIATARTAAAVSQPNVAVVDLWLGPENGLDLVSALAREHPGIRTLVLSGHDERLYADRALAAGALGYISKAEAGTELLEAIRRVVAGKTYVSAEVAETILSGLSGRSRPGDATSPLARLTDRERQVLMLMGQGLGTAEVAQQLKLSVKTVESHHAHLKEKLSLRNGRALARFAVTWAESNR